MYTVPKRTTGSENLMTVTLRWPTWFWRKVKQAAIDSEPPKTLQDLITDCICNELKITKEK